MIVNASIFSVLQGIAGGNHILFFQWRGKQIEQIDKALFTHPHVVRF